MKSEYSSIEVRIIGTLIEKQITTPEYYPLTLNSLTTACNQKSNRYPVMDLSEQEVEETCSGLQRRQLVQKIYLSNSRVGRYQHIFDEAFHFGIEEKVILCELFIRGAQTIGELKTRTARMYQFKDLDQIRAALNELADHPEGPYVVMLARKTGQKENRYMHLFCGMPETGELEDKPVSTLNNAQTEISRIHMLEERVSKLEANVVEIKNLIRKLHDLPE